ncbi:MAG TPA: hypothetical protein VF155_04250 [Candidatus Dormibacteraeota bacterium]
MNLARVPARRLITLSLLVVVTALVGCGGSSHTTPKASSRPAHSAVPTPTPPPKFTDKYGIIHAGMTLDDVRTLMGGQGNTLSEADNGAGTTSIVIEWQDPKSSKSIIVTFVNNAVASKSAIGF